MTLHTRPKVQDEVSLHAVVYSQENGHIKIHADVDIKGDEFELDARKLAKKFPSGLQVAVVPHDVQAPMQLRHVIEGGYVPTASLTHETMEHPIPLKQIFTPTIYDRIHDILPLRRRVSGHVVKRDAKTGALMGVPGAKVRVMDVDLHLLWWHPWPLVPWAWIYPIWPRFEELGTAITDHAGYFSLSIPLFEIDYLVTWRQRFRGLYESLLRPTIADALEMGIRPDIRQHPEFERVYPSARKTHLPESMQIHDGSTSTLLNRQLKRVPERMFERIDGETELLQQPAFPKSMPAPALPADEQLMEYLREKEMLTDVRTAKPMVRLARCFVDDIPTLHAFYDVPDIVFWVEQDTNCDGKLETIYRDSYFDANWDLNESTTNLVLEAWENALSMPSESPAPSYTTAVIGGFNDYPTSLLSPDGYATHVNRPKVGTSRPEARTPFCGTMRIVGNVDIPNARYYRVFYKHESMPETHFLEQWAVWQVGSVNFLNVAPDSDGLYSVLRPATTYFPYNTLVNWNSGAYPNGQYAIRMEIYDQNKGLLVSLPEIHIQVDNTLPVAEFIGLRYQVANDPWQTVDSLNCVLIHRKANADLKLEMTYQVAAEHLRDFDLSLMKCDGSLVGSYAHWHANVSDNNSGITTWTQTMAYAPDTDGAYYWSLNARSRAFDGRGGLAESWNFDPKQLWVSRIQTVAIVTP